MGRCIFKRSRNNLFRAAVTQLGCASKQVEPFGSWLAAIVQFACFDMDIIDGGQVNIAPLEEVD